MRDQIQCMARKSSKRGRPTRKLREMCPGERGGGLESGMREKIIKLGLFNF